MPKFRIGYSVSWVAGADVTEIIEADTLEEAQEFAWDEATQRLDTWAEPVEDEQ